MAAALPATFKSGFVANMNCRTCHYSFQDPALVLRCLYFNRICYQPCDWYIYEPGALA